MNRKEHLLIRSDSGSLQEETNSTVDEDELLVTQSFKNAHSQAAEATNLSSISHNEKKHISFLKEHTWKLIFFASVFFTLLILNLMFAPMMQKCSNIIISMIQP